MQVLATTNVSAQVMKNLWLDRLSPQVRGVISILDGDIEDLARKADQFIQNGRSAILSIKACDEKTATKSLGRDKAWTVQTSRVGCAFTTTNSGPELGTANHLARLRETAGARCSGDNSHSPGAHAFRVLACPRQSRYDLTFKSKVELPLSARQLPNDV
ncbi:hypothetical protein HUJ05_000621 [Dendroctonus ponderosae]|nr:hypothetical protein HUJ05_000621 [Dendroctonus ponderosae]